MTGTIRWWLYWGVAGVTLAVAFVYYHFNPADVHFFPPCLFRKLTGYHCPGCGAQRAIHQLLHGNLREAFRYNALLVLLLPYVSLGFVLDVRNQFRGGGTLPAAYRKAEVIYAVLAAIILFWILRNVPIEPFSWLAPPESGY
jgi:hypothetical protein